MLALDHGTLIHDRYRIVRRAGKGGMGAVYEAVDVRLHNIVALKRMTAEGADADRAFEQEAQLLASLRHAGLPAVSDYFIESGSTFLVMQYIEGEDLHQIRRRCGGTCAPADVLGWAVDILYVLAFLHRHDPPIVHRDLKPANLKLTPAGQMVLVDFGLAKGGRLDTTHLIGDERSIYGFTANYAPPEQLAGTGTDARSDLFALGATLYHLLTGDAPTAASARVSAVANRAPDPLRPPDAVNPEIDRRLSAIVMRALQLEPDNRYRSADEMIDALAPLRTLERERPRALETGDERRVDAAMPSEAPIGRQVDLIVQVRFAGSPLLGLEDWPSRQVPDRIEQASETVHVEYPVNPRTHQQLPARLRVKIVAPDFRIDSTPDCIIEVPPRAYSKRLAFLLTPQHEGTCRVHVEVYSIDSVQLGVVPIEADAVAAAREHPVWRVAQLVLGMAARKAPHEAFDEAAQTQAEIFAPARPAQVGAAASDLPARSRARPRGLLRWAAIATPFLVLIAGVMIVRRTGEMPAEPATAETTAPADAVTTVPQSAAGPAIPPPEPSSPAPAAGGPPTGGATRPPGPEAAGSAGAAPGGAGSPTAPPLLTRPPGVALPPPPSPGGAGDPPQAAGAAPPPPLAEAPDARARREIAELLQRYKAANEARDIATLRQLYPAVHPSVAATLKSLASLQYDYVGEPKYLELRADTRAVIEIGARQVYELRTGSGPPSETIARFTLTKVNAQKQWVIESVIHRRRQ